jgi:hypothetical protein
VIAPAEVTPRRTWLAITIATLLATVSYWAILFGFLVSVAGLEDQPEGFGAGALALGLALVPFVYVALAFLSGHKRAPTAAVLGMFLFLLVGSPVFVFNRVMGLVAGFGAGAVLSLRREERHRIRTRVAAVALGLGVLGLLLVAVPQVGLAIAPAIPFTAVGLANRRDEKKAAEEPV